MGTKDETMPAEEDAASTSEDALGYYRSIREDDPEVGDQVLAILRDLAARVACRRANDHALIPATKRGLGAA